MNMNLYNTNFEVAAFAFLLALYFYIRVKYKNNEGRNKIFRRLVICDIITILLDLITSITITLGSAVPDVVNLIVNVMYFASFGVLCYIFPFYCMSFAVTPRPKLRKALVYVMEVFLAVYMLLVILTIPFGLIFSFNNGEYIHGPLYSVVAIIPLLFVLICFGIVIFLRREIPLASEIALNLLALFTIAGPILQFFFFPDILLSNSTPAVTLVLCLLTLEEPNYNLLVTKRNELQQLKENLEQEILNQTAIARSKKEEKEQLSGQIIDALETAIDEGSIDKPGHSKSVALMSQKIALVLGMNESEARSIYYMAAVHDIGMIGVNEDVPAKDGPFNEEEQKEMEKHTEIGCKILSDITEMPDMDIVARSHHERWDGKGYPDGLKGEEIPIEARIVCVADAYDGMTARRNYKDSRDRQEAIDEFRRCSGTQFDPKIVDAVIKIISEE